MEFCHPHLTNVGQIASVDKHPWTLNVINTNINTSYQKLPFGSGEDPDKLALVHLVMSPPA